MERFLTEIEDGLASSLAVEPELARFNQGDADVVVPIGPVALIGDLADWRTVLNREMGDRRTVYEPSSNARTDAYGGDRSTYPVLESD